MGFKLTTNVSSDPAQSEVYSIQHYVIKFDSDLRQVSGFFQGTSISSTNKTDRYDIADLLLNVALKHHIPFPKMNVTVQLAFRPYFSTYFTIQPTFLPHFPYHFTIQHTFRP